ncbi:MAG: adenylate/guanylate cyclase domain-containing protein [Proteobacteria bacterium]|nr:adenylate/guanylate cyclase domain-containing protein [Pseudomonadota bacterium]
MADRGILVPVRFEGAKLPMDVRAIHTTELDDWNENPASAPFQELLRALGSMIEKQRAARSGTSAPVQAGANPSAVTPAKPRVAICVLPFVNMSGDAGQEYFSDGITEDVITDLSKVSALSVIARNTVFTFKGRNVDIPLLARQLKVSHVLEGSVRKAGQRVRISAQLIDGSSGSHVWAERYDRDLNDIFAIQDEISEAIVDALKLKLLPEEKKAIEQRGTTNLEAYNVYLMARRYSVTGNYGNVRRCEAIIRLCRSATEIDPEYAAAWALMAVSQAALRFHFSEPGDGGLAAAQRALSIDANLAEAHAAIARVLTSTSQYDDAQREIATALRLDSESIEVNTSAARLNYAQGRYEDATRFYEKAASLMESDFSSVAMLIACYRSLGNKEGLRHAAQRTLARAEKIAAQEPDNGMAMGYVVVALIALDQSERARELAKRAMLLDPDNLTMRYNFACSFLDLNDAETALNLLETVLAKDTLETVNWAKVDPDLDTLRDHPRFKAMIEGAGKRLATGST